MVITTMRNSPLVCLFDSGIEAYGEFETSLYKKRILITGASGLIGNGLCILLCSIIDSFKSRCSLVLGYHREIPAFASLLPEKFEDCSIQWLRQDLGNSNNIESYRDSFDFIFHCAGYAQPSLFDMHQIESFSINTAGLVSLAELLRPGGSLLFMSSYQVYSGSYVRSPFREESSCSVLPDNARAPYIQGKKSGEVLCEVLRKKGQRCISFRLSDIFGPGTKKNDSRAINQFIKRALLERKVWMHGTGNAVRNYCYLPDACHMILHASMKGDQSIYNIGSNESCTVSQIAQLIAEELSVDIEFRNTRPKISASSDYLDVSIDKYLKEFGQPTFHSLQQGLKQTIAWQKVLYGLS